MAIYLLVLKTNSNLEKIMKQLLFKTHLKNRPIYVVILNHV